MEIPQIKDKITARAFALQLAVNLKATIYSQKYCSNLANTISIAKDYEKYIIGDAELSEIAEDYAKNWVDTLKDIYKKQTEEEIEKRDKDWEEFKKTLPVIDSSLNSENNEVNTTKL